MIKIYFAFPFYASYASVTGAASQFYLFFIIFFILFIIIPKFIIEIHCFKYFKPLEVLWSLGHQMNF